MITFIRKKITKRKLVRKLEREALEQEMNAAYDEQVIKDLNGKIEEQKAEHKKWLAEAIKLQGRHEHEVRKEREGYMKKSEDAEQIVKGLQDMIARVIQAASNERQKAAQARHRAAFIWKRF